MEEFLASLLHFQHFRQFINHKIEQLKNQTVARDIFDREAMFYDDGTPPCVCVCVCVCMRVCVCMYMYIVWRLCTVTLCYTCDIHVHVHAVYMYTY